MKEKIPKLVTPLYRYKVLLNGVVVAYCTTKTVATRIAALMKEPYFDKVAYAPFKSVVGTVLDGASKIA